MTLSRIAFSHYHDCIEMVLINQVVSIGMLISAAVATRVRNSSVKVAAGCRLGADSELGTLPQVILKMIIQLALQPCTLKLYHVDSGIHSDTINPSDGNYH